MILVQPWPCPIDLTAFWQVFYNVIGGALVAILSWAYIALKRRWVKRAFKDVFGDDLEGFNIAYGKLTLRPLYDQKGRREKMPYEKPGTGKVFNTSSPVPFTETKSAKYLAEAFSRDGAVSPKLTADEEIAERVDVSFCSLGGYNNLKTIEVLESDQNVFYSLDVSALNRIVAKDATAASFALDGRYDYAVIIKLVPRAFPNRVWIAVAGLGEWGTSGAAWYLSRNWKKLRSLAKRRSFGLVVKVRGGQDESAEMVHSILRK